MKARMFATHVALPVLVAASVGAQAHAADFDWMKFKGKTVTFLANNNPVSQALLTYKADFEKLTGMTLKVDGYQEQQMRQRLVTV
jgi:multiple sugar transport system substrate-binding protein